MRETAQNSPDFTEVYADRLELIETGVKDFAAHLREQAALHGPAMAMAAESYTGLFERGGKRIRGVLTGVGYEMFGGEPDDPLAIQAGTIMEAVHASFLAMDDVIDKSETRRGKAAAHAYVRDYLIEQQAHGNAQELGESAANLIANWAQWQAIVQFAQLDVPGDRKDTALTTLGHGLALTGVGQILDTFSVTRADIDMGEAQRIATYKTAHYTFLLPLQVGAQLAGASPAQAEMFRGYALNAGFAFQLQDDIIGLFGDEAETGKPRTSDMTEGKPTMLFMEGLQRADGADRQTLRAAHGNPDLTIAQFEECLGIIRRSGAYGHVADMALRHVSQATDSLWTEAARTFGDIVNEPRPAQQLSFLGAIALLGVERKR